MVRWRVLVEDLSEICRFVIWLNLISFHSTEPRLLFSIHMFWINLLERAFSGGSVLGWRTCLLEARWVSNQQRSRQRMSRRVQSLISRDTICVSSREVFLDRSLCCTQRTPWRVLHCWCWTWRWSFVKTSETMKTALLVCLLMLFCTVVGETSFLSLLGLASRKNLVSAQDQALSLGHDLSRCLQVLDDSRKSTMLHCIFWNLSSWTAPGLRGESLNDLDQRGFQKMQGSILTSKWPCNDRKSFLDFLFETSRSWRQRDRSWPSVRI
jgi:hypothetical protein